MRDGPAFAWHVQLLRRRYFRKPRLDIRIHNDKNKREDEDTHEGKDIDNNDGKDDSSASSTIIILIRHACVAPNVRGSYPQLISLSFRSSQNLPASSIPEILLIFPSLQSLVINLHTREDHKPHDLSAYGRMLRKHGSKVRVRVRTRLRRGLRK